MNRYKIVALIVFVLSIANACAKDSESNKKSCKNKLNKDESLLLYLPLNGNSSDCGKYKLKTFPTNLQPVTDKNNNKNGAFSFSDNGQIEIRDVEVFKNLQAFTLCSWVFINTNREHNNIFAKGIPGRDFNLQLAATGAVNFHFYNQDYYHWYTTKRLEEGKWYHIALVFNKNTVAIYINGTKEELTSYAPTNSNTSIPLFKKIHWQGEYLTIGALGENRGEHFLGRLDDLRIYERALTKKTIRKLIRIKNREKNKYTTYSYSNEATYDEGVMKIE